MPPADNMFGAAVWSLPPLILHPFNERVPPSVLLDNSRAALILSGIIPSDGSDEDALKRRLLSGRYSELRMLYFLGKDVLRWIDQCVEWSERTSEMPEASLRPQSFAGLLTASPPDGVQQKLLQWGVVDYVSIFRRAIGLNAVFAEPPRYEALSEEFLRSYHRYADQLFRAYMESACYRQILNANFRFELYASGEYTKLLESQWG